MVHSFIAAFVREEEGQDLVEYSLLIAFIALAAISILPSIKTNISSVFTKVNTNLNSAAQ